MKKKKFLSLVLVLVMLMTLIIPAGLPVYAVSTPDSYTFDISEGNVTVAAGSTANTVKVTYGNSQITTTDFSDTQEITIIGETTTNKVLVTGYITTKIKLRDADIELSGNSCAFAIEDGANATLSLAGANTLSSYENAGLKVEDGQTVTIQDSDSDLGIGALDAKSNAYGAGIGGCDGTGGTITILSGTVNATGGKENLWWHGGNNGAGIGGGGNAMASGGNITISGGKVTAIGGRCAAGIGGGSWGAGGNIIISGGTVTATGGLVASGIGGGYNGAPGNIKILNAAVKAYSDGDQNAINAIGNSLQSGSDSDLICGKLNTALSSTISTGIDITKGDNSNTYSLELPANYLSFATTVNGSGAYNIKTKESTPRIIVNSTDNSTTFTAQHNFYNFAGVMIEQKSTIATLNDLKVNGTTISGFNSNTYTYDVILPAGTTSVPTVDTIVTDTGKANAVVTSTASLPGTATIVVTAEDGTTKNTYTINFTVETLSADSSLNNLVTSQGTLSPEFNSETKNYTTNVENSITNIKVTPTTSESHAVLKVNGNIVASGNESGNIPLNVGSNIINIIVTAQDGATTTSYTVTVIRAATIPGAPMITNVVPGNGRAEIYFTEPISNGGNDITEYIVASSPGGLTGTGLSSPISVTGLTNGTEYTFTVIAKNSVGLGEPSTLSDIVIPQVPVMTGTVAITGTEKFGETLTAIPSISTGGTVTYQWNRDGVAIDGATGTTYKLVEADIGKIITVTMTADEVTGTGKITSAATDVIAKADKAEAPMITNNPLDVTVNVGETAKLLIEGSGTGTLSYQWYSSATNINNGGTIIDGATNSSYEAPTTIAGTTYYYCTVTNTDSTAVESVTINSNTAKVTVNEVKDSTINPTIRNFDKNVENQADVSTDMTLNGNTLISITNGINILINGIDYTVSGNTVTIKKEYLANQEMGTITLVFNFSSGNTQSLLIVVSDDTTVGEDDTTAPSINTISFVTNSGNIDIIPGTTGKVDLSSLIGESGPLAVTSAAVTLDTSIEGQDDTDTKDNVEVELDFTTSRSNTLQSFGKYNGTLAETKSMLESMLAAFTKTLTTNQFKKIGGATFSLIDTKGNKSVYTIVTTASDTTPETHTITFNSNGGSAIDPVTGIASGTKIGTLPSPPIKAGYTFEGWNTAADGSGTAFTSSSIVSTNQIVYAQWKKVPTQPVTTTTGTVVDNKTGAVIQSMEAIVTTEVDGTKTVAVKSQDAILLRKPNGTSSTFSDITKLEFSAPVTTGDSTTSIVSVSIKSDGTIDIKGLTNNTETKFDVIFNLGNGQKITIGTMNIKVSDSGNLSLTSTLIDPYGIITDSDTGKSIKGVKLTLYYSNTNRNKATGKTPNTLVELPIIDGFKPSNNKNPQESDEDGAYAFMVFPAADYYIVASKDGYNKYTSPTISVEKEIVKWDFSMKKINQSGSSNSSTGSKNNTITPSDTSIGEIANNDKSSDNIKAGDNNNSAQNQITDNTQAITSEPQNEKDNKIDENVETSTVDNQINESVPDEEEVTAETTTESETPQQEAATELLNDNNEDTDKSNLQSNDSQSFDKINGDKKTGFRRFLPSFEKNIFSDNLSTGPTIDLNIDISMDSKVGGQAIMATAKGLKPFSEVKIIVYSEARVLAVGKADANGNAVITGTFPDDLEPAQHTIMAVGVGKEGQNLQTIGGFKISDYGTVTAISHPGQVITPLEPNSPRLTRAVDAGKPLYDAARYPGVVATVMISITAFLGLAGANGLNRSLNGKSPSTKKSKAKLAGVATKKLKMLKSSESGWGDNHKTWTFPGTATTDLWGSTIPNKIGKFSAVASRVIVDGSWSRAMFGAAGYILWIIGAILGGISAYSVNFMALPPALPIVFAIVALGILDSAAGAMAWVVITFCAIVTGNVTAWADIQTLLGIFVLFSSLPLLAHCIRPLRRNINGDLKEIFDRAADYIMPPVSLALAASSMIKALNGLSGLELYTADEYNKVRLIVGAVFILRIFLEDIATYLYPIRSTKVQPERLVSVSNRIQWMSVVMKVLMFILISQPFFGLGWLIFFAAVITAIPNAMKIYEDNFPNFKLLHKLYPRGNLKFTIFTIIGIYLAAWLSRQGSGDEWAKQIYIVLLLPGFISSCIEFFAREGGSYWPNPWLKRIMGIGVWSLSVGLALGIINLV